MVLCILFGVLLALCGLGSVASAQGATTVGVHLERISEYTWRVAFSLYTDAAAWAFARSGDNNRVGFLQVETEDVRLEMVGPLDMLLLDAPTREISLTVRPDIAMMGEDYTPFLDPSGGALALYTHFFQLAPIHTPSDWLEVAPNPDLETPRHLFSFTDRTAMLFGHRGKLPRRSPSMISAKQPADMSCSVTRTPSVISPAGSTPTPTCPNACTPLSCAVFRWHSNIWKARSVMRWRLLP